MKNNCDVSKEQTCCKNVINDCEFMLPNSVTFPRYCEHDKLGRCTCTAAIRAAIEADKKPVVEQRKITVEEEVTGFGG